MQIARKGDAALMRHALQLPEAIADLNVVDQRELPAIVHAIESRHHIVTEELNYPMLLGQYEEIIELLASNPAWDGGIGNPIYYAIDYRNLPALRILLKHMVHQPPALQFCLTEVDADKETVLHKSARSKSSGFVKLFMRTEMAARQSGDLTRGSGGGGSSTEAAYAAFRPAVLELHGARLPAPPHHGAWKYSASDLTAALNTADLEMLLGLSSAELINLPGGSGNTALHVAALSGNAQAVRALLAHGADASAANVNGHTPLHLAAAKGFAPAAEALVQHPAHGSRPGAAGGLDATDKQGRTALYLASEAGFLGVAKVLLDAGADIHVKSATRHDALDAAEAKGHAHIVAAMRGTAAPAGWLYPEPAPPRGRAPPAAAEGWDATPLAGVALPSGRCPFERVDASTLTAESFAERYLSIHRPVIIDGLMAGWPATTKWTREGFLKHYGEVELIVGKIPYESLYGLAPEKRLAARRFIKGEMGAVAAKRSSSPTYVFDPIVLQRTPGMLDDAPVPKQIPPPLALQFILGPRGSGAFPHFHPAAVNALVHGRKRWWLFPPGDAFFTLKNVSNWMEEDLPWLSSSGEVQMFECVQEAGQVLYVPEQWGHAVLNLKDSIAVAYEFR